MSVRFLLLLLAMATTGGFAQMGMCGPISTQLGAGDVAPDFIFTKVLNAPGSAPWNASNLS